MEVQGFPNYRIDRDGTITNIKTGKVKSSCINSQTGYKMVSLWKDNKEKGETLHRLLATHFIPNPEGKRYVDHIDRNKLNNDLSNLRWVNGTENNLNNGGQDRENHCIYHRKDRDIYRVMVQRYNVPKYVGSAKTLEEARAIRDEYLARGIQSCHS
jgi:hypothetical protein